MTTETTTASATRAPRLHPLNRDFRWRNARSSGLRRVSAEQIAQFNDQGFFVFRNAFAPDEIAEVTAAIDPLERATDDYVREKKGGRHRLSTTGAITFSAHIVTKSPVLQAFARHPAIKDICHDLIGDDVRLYWDQAVYKKTEKPQEFPWHQDNGYTFIQPQQYLTLWIPLVDVDEENGCPWIAPGIHKLGTLEHWITDIGLVCLESAADAVPAPARAGDIVVFSSLAPHRTGPNLRPGDIRKAYILQYAPDGALTTLPDGQVLTQSDPARQFKILERGA
ncbi:MAG TPA: phytanoyl-CoA dioxygenase family protein [Caulobacteraceae bacterium]|nr:phytanoyl-CoA dioxygenase family protein [Caulobacteraceae bacterium]